MLIIKYVTPAFQVVYFCRTPSAYDDYVAFDYYYKTSLEQCRWPWRYVFHLYGGRTRSINASMALSVGNGGGKQKLSCCENNPDNFTIHVMDAGQLDSYSHPVDDDYYY